MWPFRVDPPFREFGIKALEDEYDFIVVGGGTAGCVLARRLSENGQHTVLLVEQGDAADSWKHKTPLTSNHFSSPDPVHSNKFESVSDSKFADARPSQTWSLVNGVGLGGTTRINGGQYTPACPAEFDAWAEEGRPGWAFADMKPYFLKAEKLVCGSQVTDPESPENFNYPCTKVANQAAKDLGFPAVSDLLDPTLPTTCCYKMKYTLSADGPRLSSFRAYLPKDYVNSTANLHICTEAIVSKIGFSVGKGKDGEEGLRAESVEIHAPKGDGDITRVVKARREIVLACGALGSPKVLLLSGIGPQEHLKDMGINVIRHTPGVGANLHDHVFVTNIYNCPLPDSFARLAKQPYLFIAELLKYLIFGTGALLWTIVEMEIFGTASLFGSDGKLKAGAELKPELRPDFAIISVPVAAPNVPGVDYSKGLFAQTIALMKPESRGTLRLRSTNPADTPLCEMNYLSAPADYAVLRTAIRVSAHLCKTMQASGYPLEVAAIPEDLDDDEKLDVFIRRGLQTEYHYASTCRIANEEDALPGVLDASLRVHGVAGLRIADASVLPGSPAVHPQAVVYAVAEKCADMMLRGV
ncbi:FAD/NAD-P-binding domain-containing protein [Favolaschia claudopus]|uniref:FAD/NAD-P-binding domain-containing protein n=1 Tax=Favolaschia claudopus TaxID=2862362 RepID=A0AAW0A5M9_9AGAR